MSDRGTTAAACRAEGPCPMESPVRSLAANPRAVRKESIIVRTEPTEQTAFQDDDRCRDDRWRIAEARVRRAMGDPDALIEVLHTVQATFGYLDTEVLAYVSDALKIPPSRVFGVATFYSLFTLRPGGRHRCVVCTGTACYIDIRGARAILARIKSDLGIEPGETTADNRMSLEMARCIGACSLAPVVIVDGEVFGAQSPESTIARLEAM